MTDKIVESVELIRSCAQVYWLSRNYTNDSRHDANVVSAEFDLAMYGPDKEEWPGSPVGFGWEINFIFKDGDEEYITLEATFESQWIVSAERAKPGKYGPETVDAIFENTTSDTEECVSMLLIGAEKLIKYCEERKAKNI